MLILVAVTVRTVVNSGLFDHAKDATNKWATEQKNESDIGNGKVTIDGKEYNSIDEYLTKDEQTSKKEWTLIAYDGDICYGEIKEDFGTEPKSFYLADILENINIPNKDGFKLIGWRYGEEIFELDATLTFPAGVYEAKVYAVWKENDNTTYTVIYKDGVTGEIVFSDQVYEELEEGANTPIYDETPSREGYTFMGWAPTINPVVRSADAENGIITYTATWQKIPQIPELN